MALTKDDLAVGPFVKGLLTALAFGVAISASGQDLSAVLPLAFGMGFVAAIFELLNWLRDNWVADLFYSGFGVLGFLMSAVAFVGGDDCAQLPASGFRIAAFALLVAIGALAVFLGTVRFGNGMSLALGLGLFGALETLIAVSTLLGDAQSSWVLLAVLMPAAMVMGWFAVLHTDAALGVGAVAACYLTVIAPQLAGSCSAMNFNGVVLIVGYCIAYFVTTRLGRVVIPGR